MTKFRTAAAIAALMITAPAIAHVLRTRYLTLKLRALRWVLQRLR
jgi:hypothetical protein